MVDFYHLMVDAVSGSVLARLGSRARKMAWTR
jgi:hypothetical protein